ncbi:MAG: acyloxyacyl hydrolase [Bacteroidota bacterium]
MRSKKLISSILLFVLFNCTTIAQPEKPGTEHNLTAEFKMQYGFLMSHHLELDVFRSHFPAFEISLQKATFGKHRWEAEYAYPLVGISLWYSDMGGYPELGSAIALYPTINFPIIYDEKQSLNFKVGLGIGYLTNHFDRIDNYKNFAIGSHLNIAASLFFEYRLKLSKMLTFTTGMGLTHFSNGSMKTPNYGLNILTASVGISSFLSKPNNLQSRKILPKLYPFEFDGRKYLSVEFATAVAFKDMNEEYGSSYYVFAGFANILTRVSYKSKFGIGLDFTYDGSDKQVLKNKYVDVTNNLLLVKTGVNFAYELVMDRMSVLVNAGVYLSGLDRSEGELYQRFTLKYFIVDKLFANIVLSAHLGKAEYIGFGLGYQLKFIYKRKIKHN